MAPLLASSSAQPAAALRDIARYEHTRQHAYDSHGVGLVSLWHEIAPVNAPVREADEDVGVLDRHSNRREHEVFDETLVERFDIEHFSDFSAK